MKKTIVTVACLFAMPMSTTILAQDPHVHGVARLNLAIEDSELHIEFNSPAANIVGFEHAAETASDKATIATALDQLRDPQLLFALPEQADCRLQSREVGLNAEHDEHDEHDEGEAEHGEGEAEHDEGEAEHSEFEAEYRFACNQTQQLDKIELKLFERFPAIETIRLQAITPTAQIGADIEAQSAVIELK